MKLYLSLGSNLGNKREYLKKAISGLNQISKKFKLQKISPIFETPALLPPKAPEDWNQPYMNAVIEMKCEKKNTEDIDLYFKKIKVLEKNLGRLVSKRGAPRPIDIDILYIENLRINKPHLTVPHKDLKNRPFFLTPLKFLNPSLPLDSSLPLNPNLPLNPKLHLLKSKKGINVLSQLRTLKSQFPLLVAIINLTPDSFSDGGEKNHLSSFKSYLKKIEKENIQALDLGAESTRPNALALEPKEEWKRLFPILSFLKTHYKKEILRPIISLDTRFSETAEKALTLEATIDWINDVSGLQDQNMIALLQSFPKIKYVLTHSLCVPVNPNVHIPLREDPVLVIQKWLDKKLNELEKNKIDLNRIIFDPGIGFGKTALQSLEILRRIKDFQKFPVCLLVGHSRKSFMNCFTSQGFSKRDFESLGISLWLSHQGVDILRVHDVIGHIRAFRGWNHMNLNPLYLD